VSSASHTESRFDSIARRLAELDYEPLITESLGRLLYELALRDGIDDLVELGFAQGTSSAYLAAALDEKGQGLLTTIDRAEALERVPNIRAVLGHLGLERWVRPVFAADSYTWELLKIVEAQTSDAGTLPCFDLCFLDGAHTWETDGFAFLLVDRLLRPDRWIVFDDLRWSFAASPTLRDSERVARMGEDERSAQQVHKIVDLLVRPRGYEVRLLGNVALAYKPDPGGDEVHRGDFDELARSNASLMSELAFDIVRSR
jgi:predicted O-methyltransferase YrrM